MKKTALLLLVIFIFGFSSCERASVGKLTFNDILSLFSASASSEEIKEPDYIDFTVHRVHYGLLSEKEQKVYRVIYNSVFSHPEKIFIPQISEAELSSVFTALKNDNPHLLCLANTYSYFTVGNRLCFLPEYTGEAEKCNERCEKTVEVAKGIAEKAPAQRDDFHRELYLHDTLTRETRFETGGDCETAYGALIKHRAQCSGYSLAFKLLLDIGGLESFTVDGSARSTDGKTELHKWNCVKINGEWYFVDPTWNDPVTDKKQDRTRHNYFNVTEAYISGSHFGFDLPDTVEITAEKDNYYIRNGLYCSRDNYRDIIKEKLNKVSRLPVHLELRMSDSTLMSEAVEELFNKEGLAKLFWASSKYWDSISVHYSADEEGSIIQIYLDTDKEG